MLSCFWVWVCWKLIKNWPTVLMNEQQVLVHAEVQYNETLWLQSTGFVWVFDPLYRFYCVYDFLLCAAQRG